MDEDQPILKPKIFNTRVLRGYYFNTLAIGGIFLLGGYTAWNQNLVSLFPAFREILIKDVAIFAMLALSLGFSFYEKNQRSGIRQQKHFEQKKSLFTRFYKQRQLWNLFSITVSMLILISTGRTIWLFFSIFEIMSIAAFFPSELFLRRILEEEELVVVKQ